MSAEFEVVKEVVPSQTKANELLEKLIAVARPDAVFSQPVEAGEYKVITAAEVSVGLGFGFGGGAGFESEEQSENDTEQKPTGGYGGGGGGGGATMTRPVAAIEIGPHGVRVEPIVDPTKIAIAFFTTMVSMFAMMAKMRRARRS